MICDAVNETRGRLHDFRTFEDVRCSHQRGRFDLIMVLDAIYVEDLPVEVGEAGLCARVVSSDSTGNQKL